MRKYVARALAAMLVLQGALAVAPSARADEMNRVLLLRNESDSAIIAFYASNVGTDEWRADILGNGVLDPGADVWLDLDDASGFCRFDLKTVFDDGTFVVHRNVNVCRTHLYTLTS